MLAIARLLDELSEMPWIFFALKENECFVVKRVWKNDEMNWKLGWKNGVTRLKVEIVCLACLLFGKSACLESVRISSAEQEEEQKKSSLDGVRAIPGGTSAAATGKKKKKRNSLVRKLSLSKFRLGSSEHQQQHIQEHLRESTRHTPEGGDSSRSQSQSSHESTIHTDSASPRHQKNRHQCREADCGSNEETTLEKRRSPSDRRDDEAGKQTDVSSSTNDREKGSAISNQQIQTSRARHQDTTQRQHHKHESKPFEKTLSTVTTVIRKSPSLTIRTNLQAKQQDRDNIAKTPHGEISPIIPVEMDTFSHCVFFHRNSRFFGIFSRRFWCSVNLIDRLFYLFLFSSCVTEFLTNKLTRFSVFFFFNFFSHAAEFSE